VGGRFHLRLTISPNAIAHKYHEGQVESTLERELNVPEVAVSYVIGISLQYVTCFGLSSHVALDQRRGQSAGMDHIRCAGTRPSSV